MTQTGECPHVYDVVYELTGRYKNAPIPLVLLSLAPQLIKGLNDLSFVTRLNTNEFAQIRTVSKNVSKNADSPRFEIFSFTPTVSIQQMYLNPGIFGFLRFSPASNPYSFTELDYIACKDIPCGIPKNLNLQYFYINT